MKSPAFVFLALSAAFLGTSVCQAQQHTVEKAPPAVAVPAPASQPAPAHHSRSLQKAPVFEAPAPAPASKPDSGNPDVVVGGLPGAKSATAGEKQP
jgi:hypothetical protein